MAGTSAKFEVLLTEGAEHDLEAIYDYLSEFGCVTNANYVLDELMSVVISLLNMQSVLARRLLGA